MYFIDQYTLLENKETRKWIPFTLWPCQKTTLEAIHKNDLLVVLKARKMGLTWLCISYLLWDMLFRPGGAGLLFSLTDGEAMDLLDRLRKMHQRLPLFLQASIGTDNGHELEFSYLGSTARAFPCTKEAGRNLTGNMALIDEADHIPHLKSLVASVQPGVERGGKLIMISAANKDTPASEFKQRYRDAVAGRNNYTPIFLAWYDRPDRDENWYRDRQRDYEEDSMKANFPATAREALAPRSMDKRFRPEWLGGWELMPSLEHSLTVPGLVVFEAPEPGEKYVLPADPAEGNPSSDPSAGMVLNSKWEQCAVFSGKVEPDVFGGYLVELAEWYNDATIVPERNNHGHAVILQIRNLGFEHLLYVNPHDSTVTRKKFGWLSTPRHKSMAMDLAAQTLRDSAGRILRDEATVNELVSIEASSLKAPSGATDDLAMTVIIGYAALRWPSMDGGGIYVDAYIEGVDAMVAIDRGGYV